MSILILLILVAGVALRSMSPEERARLLQRALAVMKQARDAAALRRPDCEAFRDALKARTPRAVVTPALVAVNAAIFVFMLVGPGALGNAETLVGWGGNFGPRTTNGEWWRLVTATFVHSSMLALVVNIAGLVQIGLILERLVGPLAFGAVYIAGGVFASLVSLSAHPMAASAGASGAIFGLYGLLFASLIWGAFYRSSVTIPLTVLKTLGPAAIGFILYNVANNSLVMAAELTAVGAGFIFGLVLARGVSEAKPPARRVAAAMAATVVMAVPSAVALRGIDDVRPEIELIVAVENRTASAYEIAVDRFRSGRMTADALVQLIDRTIIPELQAAEARLKALDKVPQEQQPLVEGADEYLRLRSESWRFRAEGLRGTNMLKPRDAGRTTGAAEASSRRGIEAQYRAKNRTLGKAEGAERESLEALQRIKALDQK